VPREILERLNAALNEALKDSAVRVRFEEIGAVPIGLELDKAKTFLVDEVVKYRDIITKAGIARIEKRIALRSLLTCGRLSRSGNQEVLPWETSSGQDRQSC
jgi:hypothetical protein